MAYAKFDDGFGNHPKVRPLSPWAFQLHVCGILHCSRWLTDGIVTADALPDLMRKYRASALQELLDAGLWRPILDGDGYVIHDYLQWNDSRAKVEARRAKNAERLSEWRRKHGKDDA